MMLLWGIEMLDRNAAVDGIAVRSGVYLIRNVVNGNSYVGSSVNVLTRLAVHTRMLRNGSHHSSKLQRAFDKYGEDAFEMFFYWTVNPEFVLQAEQIVLDDPRFGQYNILPVAGNCLGRKHTVETIEKLRGYKRTPEQIETYRAAKAGAKPSAKCEEARLKAITGKKRPEEVVENQRRKLSETRTRQREEKYGPDSEGKRCSRCGEKKPHSEFGSNKARRDGYQEYCKSCYKEFHDEYKRRRATAAT